jgi:Winged helix-turn helix
MATIGHLSTASEGYGIAPTEVHVKRAAELSGISIRQVRRLRAAYRERGAASLAHGNRGRRPAHALDQALALRVVLEGRGPYLPGSAPSTMPLASRYRRRRGQTH